MPAIAYAKVAGSTIMVIINKNLSNVFPSFAIELYYYYHEALANTI
jgi:hypothetical protein